MPVNGVPRRESARHSSLQASGAGLPLRGLTRAALSTHSP